MAALTPNPNASNTAKLMGQIARSLRTEKNPDELQNHVMGTYRWLRWGLFALGIALPIVLWVFGRWRFGLSLLGSMSAYYHTEMRDVLTGGLWAIGGLLIIYKGFGFWEDVGLNAAGVCSILVALFPVDPPSQTEQRAFTLHGFFAVGFFIFATLVCWFSAKNTLSLLQNGRTPKEYERLRAIYKLTYDFIGICMIAIPATIWFLVQLQGLSQHRNEWIFRLETAGFWVFSAYWAVKSVEIQRHTKAEEEALERDAVKAPDGTIEAV